MRINLKILLLAALCLPAGNAFAQSYTSKVYKDTNGDRIVVGSGGTLKVLSGGTVTLDSGATSNQNGTLKINGNTVTATTGTATVTIPNSTDTLVNLTGTQTLSGKTLTSPVINGPVPVACGGTCTLGAANVGAITKLDTAGGSVATLPAATGTGTKYSLVVTVANSSNSDKVLLTTVTDTIIGTAVGENAGTAKVFVGNASTYHSIAMPFAGSQPSGGFVGDEVTCTDIASTIWFCNVKYQAGTTPTTPYSASTS